MKQSKKIYDQISQRSYFKLTRGFLVTYLLMLLIPFASGFILYLNACGIIVDNSRTSVKSRLIDAAYHTDSSVIRYFAEIDKLALCQEVGDILSIRNFTHSSEQISDLYRVASWKVPYLLLEPSIVDYQIYSKDSGIVVTSKSVYYSGENYFDNFFSRSDMSATEWLNIVNSGRHVRKIFPASYITAKNELAAQPNNTQSIVTFIQSIPVGSGNDGYIALLVSESEMMHLMGGLNLSRDGMYFVYDSNGSLISHSNGPDTAPNMFPPGTNLREIPDSADYGGITYELTTVVSKYLGWTYIAAVPDGFYAWEISALLKKLLVVDLLVLILCTLIGVYLSCLNAKPWEQIINAINEGEPILVKHRSIINQLSRQAVTAIENTHTLTYTQTLLKEQLINNVVDKIITQPKISIEFIEEECKIAGLSLCSPYYCAVCLEICGCDGVQLSGLLRARKVFETDPSILMSAMPHGSRAYMLAMLKDPAEVERLEYLLRALSRELSPVIGRGTLRAGISRPYSAIEQSSVHIREAEHCLDCACEKDLIYATQLTNESSHLNIAFDFDVRLWEQITIGNVQGVSMIFDQMHNDHIPSLDMNVLIAQQLKLQLCSSICRILSHLRKNVAYIQEITDELNSLATAEAILYVRRLCFELCDEWGVDKKNKSLSLQQKIIMYADKHFDCNCLCLDTIKDEFRCSAGQVNEAFIALTGLTFSSYVEKIRLEAACRFLSGDININNIAENTGYASSHSFRRAFKRRYGIQPVEYRKLAKTESLDTCVSGEDTALACVISD